MNLEALKEAQVRLAQKVVLRPIKGEVRIVVGLDAAYGESKVRGAAVAFDAKTWRVLDRAIAETEVPVPYVPGFLSFREAPVLLKALNKLEVKPQLLLVDGQGIAHPRRLGIASHIGVLTGLPSVGCAKNLLVGEAREPGLERGAWEPVYYQGQVVGALVRTRRGVKPVVVSPGHLITLEEAVRWVLRLSRFRIPEPIRLADRLSKERK